jgi:hypothetical protein
MQQTTDQAKQEAQQLLAKQALSDPEALKRWLLESGRKFVVLVSQDLVDSLPWPEGVRQFTTAVDSYRAYRMQQASSKVEQGRDLLGRPCEITVQKSDALDPMELNLLVHWAAAQLLEYDPGWTYQKGLTRTQA